MGTDKGFVDYHGKPQREHVYHLLEEVCDEVFLSIRPQQQPEVAMGLNTIVDQDKFKGPFNGILSAFDIHPNIGWLVMACDLPLMDLSTIQQLIADRNFEKSATAFVSPETLEPEPLCCIWEPKGLEGAIDFLEGSNSISPKRFLMSADIAMVHPKNEIALFNANTLSDYEFVKGKLREQEGS